MKIYFTLLCFLLLFLSASSTTYAQLSEEEKLATLDNESNRKHIFKTNLLSLLTRSVSLGYEHALSKTMSIQAGGYYSKSKMFRGVERISASLELRKYMSRPENAIVGWYLAPYVKYQQIKDTEESFSGDVTARVTIRTVGAGLQAGKQWIAKKGFTVDIYAGAGFNPIVYYDDLEVIDASLPYTFSRSKWQRDIRLGVVIGYAF
ncbi:DUF3575 domain-containing protein [Rhodocytophaga rosea]|uniref:DUF3575 domain-containing protein n=1 Tax=Rhodocytophaga rosea TaxID=2704465 RepID=A0A6C0GID2_9BACT|nr:DUF3575 domain-containing protein [Rhodocytophaga rosea]QHT67443.1 DUF3575 domain-containing protein [Rhodocytophaga rosea]